MSSFPPLRRSTVDAVRGINSTTGSSGEYCTLFSQAIRDCGEHGRVGIEVGHYGNQQFGGSVDYPHRIRVSSLFILCEGGRLIIPLSSRVTYGLDLCVVLYDGDFVSSPRLPYSLDLCG